MAGQTINDRFLAARHSLAGQGLAKSVCKATTEEMIGPKKKHLDYLVHCTNEPNVSIPHLANLLIERSQNANWVVVYKALITVHHLLAYGNERFMQYLASSNSTFNLSNFLDKGGVQGTIGARIDLGTKDIGYDMSPFIRRYAKYLNEKAMSYRTVAFDFCKMKRGKEEGTIRTMNADKLLKTLPVLQAQLDGLLEFDCTANDLTNGVISMSFTLLFRDLIRLFACYNDGIINMLEKYFDMNKKQCRDALDLYKRFLVRMDRVGEFLKVAENMGMDKGELPDLTKAPSSLLDALEGHLGFLEGKKGSAANTPTQTASSSFGTAAASTRFENNNNSNGIDEAIKAQALAEEEAAMNQYKVQYGDSKLSSPGANNASTNPFLSSPPAQSQAPIVDLFDAPSADMRAVDPMAAGTGKASDDLLGLGNPFADMFAAPPANAAPAQMPMGNNMWMGNGVNGTSSNTFVSDSNFSSVFGNTEPAGHLPMASGYNTYNQGPFKLQAATEPNPFFGTETSGEQRQEIVGGGGGANRVDPPSRPPPPAGGMGASPAKSAFDDLNDSIRMAMGGGSPAKTGAPIASVGPQPTVVSGVGGGYVAGGGSTMYPSPAKQPLGGGFDALGDVLKPGSMPTATSVHHTGGLASGGPTGGQTAAAQSGKVLTGDLDSSLASLAENLTINKSASAQVKGMQWNSPKNAAKPGQNWTPQPMAATTGAGYRPMAQGMTVTPAPSTIYPSYPQYFQQQSIGGIRQPMMPPQMGMPGGQPMMMAPGMAAQPPMMSAGAQPNQANVQLDPFGTM